MSKLQWQDIAEIQKAPSYFRGAVHFPQHDNWRTSISTLRSWQHKESRRSTPENMQKLQQCVMLQASKGYFLNALQYFVHTIVPEDIGMAQPDILVHLCTTLSKWEKILKKTPDKAPWPMSLPDVTLSLKTLLETCDTIARSRKNRFVPSLVTISVMHHVNHKWSSDASWSTRLKTLKKQIKLHISSEDVTDTAILINNHIRPILLAMEDCLLYIEWMKEKNKKQPKKDVLLSLEKLEKPHAMYNELDDALVRLDTKPARPFLNSIWEMNRTKHSRLWFYLFVLACRLQIDKPLESNQNVEDLDQIFTELFPVEQDLPQIPSYAMDKHTGQGGGYERFQSEGIYVPSEMIWQPELNQQLSDESFQLRFAYEEKHGLNASKTSKVIEKLIQENLTRPDKNRKRTYLDDLDVFEALTRQPAKKKARVMKSEKKTPDKTEQKKLTKPKIMKPKMQPIFDVPVGQTVTGRAKKYVYIYPEVVKKGPYLSKDQNQVDFMLRATKLIQQINERQGISSTVIEPFLEKTDKDTFVCWKNIGHYNDIKTEKRTTKLAEDVTVVSRKTLIHRASDVKITDLSDQLWQDCLNHLYARAIVGVGDSGLWNILIQDLHKKQGRVEGQCIGIDLEEARSFKTQPVSKIHFLFSKVYNADFWKDKVKYVKQISVQEASQFLSKDMVQRVELFASLPTLDNIKQ